MRPKEKHTSCRKNTQALGKTGSVGASCDYREKQTSWRKNTLAVGKTGSTGGAPPDLGSGGRGSAVCRNPATQLWYVADLQFAKLARWQWEHAGKDNRILNMMKMTQMSEMVIVFFIPLCHHFLNSTVPRIKGLDAGFCGPFQIIRAIWAILGYTWLFGPSWAIWAIWSTNRAILVH